MTDPIERPSTAKPSSLLENVIFFCLHQKLVVVLFIMAIIAAGVFVAPFDWNVGGIDRSPVAVDAIPDIGENQQIIFTEWMGRSPQDVEDQITYPLTVALLGIPEVKTIRSYSFFGFSSIYVIFNEKAEFYWSRSRVLEKLNSLPAGTVPDGVQPALGPDATALGQIYWYTLEGHDLDGNPIGGFDLHELRSLQDWTVRYGLASAEGVSEVASIGGFVQEYQIDVDPDAMRANDVTLAQVFQGIRMSNVDVGARTIELNKAEYVIRGLGFFENPADIEKVVLKVNDDVPITVKDVAKVSLGPALRRGVLDKGGAEAVGGVVVVRYGFNPLQAIKNVKAQIAELEKGLPTHVVFDYEKIQSQREGDAPAEPSNDTPQLGRSLALPSNAHPSGARASGARASGARASGARASGIVSGDSPRQLIEDYARQNDFEAFVGTIPNHDVWSKHLRGIDRDQWPSWANLSQVKVVEFYDRSGLIYETLGTLNIALYEEILVTILVIIISP